MHINKPLTDLKFNVAQLLREDIGGRRSYSFQEEALLLDGDIMLRQIVGEVRFTRTASGVLADADVRGMVETQCIRCLTAVQVPLELAFRDEFHSVVEVNTGSPLPKPAEDDPFFINENHLLDLGEAIREYGLIEMPMRPLCREDCKGLCPQCGVDRNTTQCSCSDDDGDDRLSVLQQLLDKNR